MDYFRAALFLLSLGQSLYNWLEKRNIITQEQRRAYLQVLADATAAAQIRQKNVNDANAMDEKQVDDALAGDFRDKP